MASLSRALLILLLIAVPLRGYAATAMQLCGFSHHGPQATASHGAHDHDAHEHASPAHHEDHHHDGDVSTPGNDGAGSTACSLCGACCVGASASPHSSKALMFASHSTAIPFVSPAFSVVVLDGADRPPLDLVA
jgi:hypothetical protein